MSGKSKDRIGDLFKISYRNLNPERINELNEYIRLSLSVKEIEEIDFRVIGNLILAQAKALSLAVNQEILEPISQWLNDSSWLEKFKVCDKEIPDWVKYKRRQRLYTRQQKALAAEKLKAYRQAIIKKRKLRHKLSKIVGGTNPGKGCSHQFRSGFMVPIVSPFSPHEQHKERTRQQFFRALSFPIVDLLPWKLFITVELTNEKNLKDLDQYYPEKRLDLICKIMHLLQMESEGKISITQRKPFGDLKLESLQKDQESCITVTDDRGKDYRFDWHDLSRDQRKKIVSDIHKHRILCKTV
jgi:hypothetical protein